MAKKSRSRLWFLIHSWLALPIWFFLLIICVTGTLAAVSQEIVWLANPDVRANKPEQADQRLSYGQIKQAIEQAEPGLRVQWISRPSEDHFALNVRVSYPDGRSPVLYVNPYTGVIQGETPQFDFSQFTRALHGWWLVPFTNGYSWGWYLVSLMSLPMLLSLITGLVVYKRFWRGFFNFTLRLKHGPRIFWGDFHRLAGVWSIWFIATMTITGFWFLLQAILADNHITLSTEGIPPVVPREQVPLAASASEVPRLSLDQTIQIASNAIAGLEPDFVSLPSYAYGPVMVWGHSSYPLISQSASINPYNGEVQSTRLLSDRSPVELVTESMRPLHTGDFGGLWSKLIWFFFGLLLSMMVLSGLLIWSKRTYQATVALKKRPQRTERAVRAVKTLEKPV